MEIHDEHIEAPGCSCEVQPDGSPCESCRRAADDEGEGDEG